MKHKEGRLVVAVPGEAPGTWESNQSISVRHLDEDAREEAPEHLDSAA